jgi:glycerol-3-phosphate dehydrogenase
MTQKFTVLNRAHELSLAQQEIFDLIVIGGGITGCGIALDAAARGLKTILLEKHDFASGTSSKSTKLIHGGLRYLKQLEIGLVRETGTERAIVHRIAPHLVHPERMLLPIVKGGTFSRWSASVAISVYDLLAGVTGEDKKRSLSLAKTLEIEPLLNEAILKSGIEYAEYRTDDARLTIEVIKKAVSLGSTAFNYMAAQEIIYTDTKATGVLAHDLITGTSHPIQGKIIVSAAGPWVDEIREKDKSKKGKTLRLTKGVHIVVSREKFPIRHAVYFDSFDGRMMFAIPRGTTTYIGTSDTDYTGDKDRIRCTRDDVDYILSATNVIFPTINLCAQDVVSTWAGLRPLIQEEGKSPSEVSRKDEIFISESGLISIAGGKLTGYRKMAQRICFMVDKLLKRPHRSGSSTKKIKLTDQPYENYADVKTHIQTLGKKIGHDLAWYLVTNYGHASEQIISRANADTIGQDWRKSLLLSELDYSIEHEMVAHPVDFIDRRSGLIYFGMETVNQFKQDIIDYMAHRLSVTDIQKNTWLKDVDRRISDARDPE